MQQKGTEKTRRIRQISVTNLFGTFNHVIPLNMDEHITIIHGPNGFGKTMVLKLLHALFSQRNRFLKNIPFDEFKVDFDDNISFWVSKTPLLLGRKGEEEEASEQQIVFHVTGNEPYTLDMSPLLEENISVPLRIIDSLIPSLDRIGPKIWRYSPIGEVLSLEDVLERFGDRLPSEVADSRKNMPEWLIEIRKLVPMRFICLHTTMGRAESAVYHFGCERVSSNG